MAEELRVYTVKTAAEVMTLSEKAVWRLCRSGALRSKRSGRRILIPASAIHDYLNKETPVTVVNDQRPQRPAGGCTNCGAEVRTRKHGEWLCSPCAKASQGR